MKAPRQSIHQLTHSLSHSHSLSLVHLSLYSLPHSSKEEEKERRRKEKGLELGDSKRWPWRSPRGRCPQEVGVRRGRSPLTLAIWS